MNAKRLTLIFGVSLAALLLGLLAGTYLLGKTLTAESKKLAVNKGTVQQLTEQEQGLSKSKHDIAKYSSLEAITKSIVPQDKDQAATVREIIKIASASHVALTGITFPSSTLGANSGTSVTAPSAAAAAKPNLSQLTPVKGMPGVYNLQITINNNATNTVTYNQLVSFLKGLENNRRTAAVRSINIQPQTGNPNQLVFTLIINTYIKP